MTIKSVDARCINCREEVKREYTKCRKCGDPVAIIKREGFAVPRRLTETEYGSLPILDPAVLAKPVSTVQLSDEQTAALGAIGDWFVSPWHFVGKQVFRLFGPAGTGKTTLAKHLARALDTTNIVYGAYTGKAAHVLRSKGVPATTIHSAVYCPVDNKEARARWEVACRKLAALVNPDPRNEAADTVIEAMQTELEREIAQLEEAIRHGVQFELNPMSPWADADLIVLDEVSMVNEQIGRDIESFGVPILVLGDPFQLPPVEGGGYWTKGEPDVMLKEVHRFYLDSPVGALATGIRTNRQLPRGIRVNLEAAMAADQILCWKNSTRHALTAKIRERLGRPAGVPVPGDRVMCLVNNKDLGIFNGQQFEVLPEAHTDDYDAVVPAGTLLLRDDDGAVRRFEYDPDGFRGELGEKEAKQRRRHAGRVGLFTFANVITVHKAQGSEWDHVYVVDQTHQMWKSTDAEKRRWLYTAVTRASERVTLASTEIR